jgi:hypothetical protein
VCKPWRLQELVLGGSLKILNTTTKFIESCGISDFLIKNLSIVIEKESISIYKLK